MSYTEIVLPLDIDIHPAVWDVLLTLLAVAALVVGFVVALVLAGGPSGDRGRRSWK